MKVGFWDILEGQVVNSLDQKREPCEDDFGGSDLVISEGQIW